MKKIIVFTLLIVSNFLFSQAIDEATFKNDLNLIIKDATTGFQTNKGAFLDKSKWTNITNNYSNSGIFSDNQFARISYQPSDYLVYSKQYIKEEYYFCQCFNYKNDAGIFVYENAERIYDNYSVENKLKKKLIKQDKQLKDKVKRVDYNNKNGEKVLSIYFDNIQKSTCVYVYSDLRPSDIATYYGCMIVYNFQDNTIVSANTYYVYGKNFKSAEILYNGIWSRMDPSSQKIFIK